MAATEAPQRTLVVVRHGKSDWSGADADRDRPVGARGERQSAEAGAWLAAHVGPIDAAVVSPARRARMTWEHVAAELVDPPAAALDERIYGGWDDELLAVVRELPAAVVRAVLVGHNPGVEELVEVLTGEWVAMPTAAVAVVDLDGPWSGAGPGRGRLRTAGRPPEGS